VGFSSGDFVLHWDPAPLTQKRAEPHNFWLTSIVANGSMDQDATWCRGRPRPRRFGVRWGLSEDAAWYGGKRLPSFFSALSLPITNMKLPANELIPCVSRFCLDEWQDIWNCCEGNKLHCIYPTVGIVKHSKNVSRYDSVLLNRLRIGHSRLTDSYLLCGDDSPTCQSCRILLTVKHRLVECPNLRDIRKKILHGVFSCRLV